MKHGRSKIVYAWALVLVFGACSGGKSNLVVTVHGNGLVDHFDVTASFSVTDSMGFQIPVKQDLSTNPTFAILFDASRQGSVMVTVKALDAQSAPLGTASGQASIVPGRSSVLELTIGIELPDMLHAFDLQGAELNVDLASADLPLPDAATPDGWDMPTSETPPTDGPSPDIQDLPLDFTPDIPPPPHVCTFDSTDTFDNGCLFGP